MQRPSLSSSFLIIAGFSSPSVPVDDARTVLGPEMMSSMSRSPCWQCAGGGCLRLLAFCWVPTMASWQCALAARPSSARLAQAVAKQAELEVLGEPDEVHVGDEGLQL